MFVEKYTFTNERGKYYFCGNHIGHCIDVHLLGYIIWMVGVGGVGWSLLEFGDLDLIFKVKWLQRLSNFVL